MTQETNPPLRIREADGSPNIIPVFDIILSDNLTLQNRGGSVVAISATTSAGASGVAYARTGNTYLTVTLTDDLTAERNLVAGRGIAFADSGAGAGFHIYIPTPLDVSSGGTGTTTFQAFRLLYGSGGVAVQTMPTLNSGWLVTGSSTTERPHVLPVGSQGQILQVNSGSVGWLTWVDSSAGGSSVVYAPTGGEYLVYGANATLTAERVIAASDNITIVSSGTSFLISSVTGGQGIVQSGAALSLAFYPSLGAAVSGSTISTSTGTDVAPFNINFYSTTAASATSGDVWVIHSNNALYWQGMSSTTIKTFSAITATPLVYAATGNSYVVMNLAADLTAEHRLVQSGNSITITTAAGLITINAVTSPTMTTQVVRIPMALLSVEVNSGNAFWTAQTDTTRMDKAYVNMTDSGRSVSTWWCQVPTNVNATPAWSVDIFSEAATLAATGGFLVLNVDGMSAAHGESANTLAASTINLVAAGSFLLNTAGILTMSTMSSSDFDGTLATSATDYMKIKITRQGNADTFNSDWYIYSVLLKATVDT